MKAVLQRVKDVKMVELQTTNFDGLVILSPRRHSDDRGFFSEVYSEQVWSELGLKERFVQDGYSYSSVRGTVHGLHFQRTPFSQAKLVWVSRGRVFDVAVDLRHGSPTYGRHWAGVLSADEWNQVVIPEGFAHGYCTLQDECAVQYKMTAPYALEHEGGILWNDPVLGIDWPVEPKDAAVSERDTMLPPLRDLPTPDDGGRR